MRAKLSWNPQMGSREGGPAQITAQAAPPSPADTLQTHSGLFLEELEMLVPSTPTSASGAFWKGSELGTDPPAQPAAPSTTSEVVKSKSASPPDWGGDPYSTSQSPAETPLPPPPQRLLWDEGAPGTHPWAWQRAGSAEKREERVPRGQTRGHEVGGHP